MHKAKKVCAVILVGGKGKRLRPLSTDAKPKAFLSVTKDRKTMFKVTLNRIKRIIPSGNVLVSANKAHGRLIKRDFPGIRKANLILEPVSRNTAPAITLAAVTLKKRFKDAVMVVLPADQYIPDEKKYLATIKNAVTFAAKNDCLVILGLKPTFPSTGFGYIKIKNRKTKHKNIYRVDKFTEKPDLKTAKRFLKDGSYLWNAGAFVFRISSILGAMAVSAPQILKGVKRFNKLKTTRIYENLPGVSIDYAVMEKADNIFCVKGRYRWQDIGSFNALKEVLRRESRKFILKNGKVTHIL